MMKKPLIIITGPTASGKTALSVELAKKIGKVLTGDSPFAANALGKLAAQEMLAAYAG